jgi:single-stranded-DNA-specific exonuclease
MMNTKKWVEIPYDAEAAAHLEQALGVAPVFGRLLAQRGLRTFDEAKHFFRPELVHLHDPFLMADMDKAVLRLEKALANKEKILLYGDYDVDGTTSVALAFDFLSRFTNHISYYIPDRYEEGYGLSAKGVEHAHSIGAGLLITLDCGIRAVDKIALANSYGIDTIVCDHHLPEGELPLAHAVLNPKRADCDYPFKELSGCGVAFKLLQGYVEKNSLDFSLLEDLLDLVALSIACDIVDMTDENRVLAFYGLRRINHSPRLGLHYLIKNSSKQPPLSATDVVFGLGPMINAAGRLGDAKQAVRLLLANDKRVADDYARFLSGQNKLRQDYDKQIVGEATKLFLAMPDHAARRSIVLFQPHWQKGIVGISAARLVEQFYRPAIVLTASKGKVVGSGRSIAGFDLHAALVQCADLLENFGGHAHAVGLTLAEEHLDEFTLRLEQLAGAALADEQMEPQVSVAGDLSLEEIDAKFWRILQQFAPFGPKNRRPVFVARGVKDTGHSRLLKDDHLRLSVQQGNSAIFEGIGFGLGRYIERVQQGAFDLCFVLDENNWRGKKSLQLDVRDIQ